jgi:sugar phosphate isomerase/epimerase
MGFPLAIHSIGWGSEIKLATLAAEIACAGYKGVELFQDPRKIGSAAEVYDVFTQNGLTLVGICGGTFKERVSFVVDYSHLLKQHNRAAVAPYVYLDDEIDSDVKVALEDGHRIALHPHMYKLVQTMAEAESQLELYEKLLLIPDTAHLYIAGDNAVDAIKRYSARLASIHLKNWKRNVGLSFQFYGRGFCELDEGDIDMEAVLSAALTPMKKGVWLVVEHDRPKDPLASASRSFTWINRKLGTTS